MVTRNIPARPCDTTGAFASAWKAKPRWRSAQRSNHYTCSTFGARSASVILTESMGFPCCVSHRIQRQQHIHRFLRHWPFFAPLDPLDVTIRLGHVATFRAVPVRNTFNKNRDDVRDSLTIEGKAVSRVETGNVNFLATIPFQVQVALEGSLCIDRGAVCVRKTLESGLIPNLVTKVRVTLVIITGFGRSGIRLIPSLHFSLCRALQH